MSTLQQQIWIDQIQEKFYPEVSFLKHVRNFDQYTKFDIINMADAGFDPNVLIILHTQYL